MSAEEHQEKEFMLETLTQQKIKYSLTSDWLHFVALCGVFPASTKAGIFKNWGKYEDLFIALVQEEGKIGVQHFMQAIVLYFIKKYNKEMSKYASTFMKKLVDEKVLRASFLINWYDKVERLDKDSMMYDKKSERKFRELNEPFFEWLRKENEQSGDDSSDSEEEKKETVEEVKTTTVEEETKAK